ncbi:MAG: AMP-binding protein [Bryobacterales bacterium]
MEAHTIPLFHANGWGRPHTLTYMGGRHVMVKRFDPAALCALIEREGVTAFSMVPTMGSALLQCPELDKHDLSSLEEVMLGASPLRRLHSWLRSNASWAARFCVGYGLTESGPVVAAAYVKSTLGKLDDESRIRRQAMTGFAIAGAEMRVVDVDGVDLPRDGQSIGEILIRSDSVMDGYWNEPEATAAAMDGDWLHTGDMAVWDEDGYVLIVDRKKDIIISGGENISSIEIEKTIAAHPAVYECAVIGVPHEKWGETPRAIVALKPGETLDADAIRQHVREHLAGFKVPSQVDFVPELPKGATGKILKRVLREPHWDGREKKVQGAGESA